MLSPLTIVSLDQGKIYGSKPTIDKVHAGMIADLGLLPDEARAATIFKAASTERLGRLPRLRQWLAAMARRLQPSF